MQDLRHDAVIAKLTVSERRNLRENSWYVYGNDKLGTATYRLRRHGDQCRNP